MPLGSRHLPSDACYASYLTRRRGRGGRYRATCNKPAPSAATTPPCTSSTATTRIRCGRGPTSAPTGSPSASRFASWSTTVGAVQNLLGAHHFIPETNQLNAAGQLRVQWIMTQAPPDRRSIFVERSLDPNVNTQRMAAVREYATQVALDGRTPQVAQTHPDIRRPPGVASSTSPTRSSNKACRCPCCRPHKARRAAPAHNNRRSGFSLTNPDKLFTSSAIQSTAGKDAAGRRRQGGRPCTQAWRKSIPAAVCALGLAATAALADPASMAMSPPSGSRPRSRRHRRASGHGRNPHDAAGAAPMTAQRSAYVARRAATSLRCPSAEISPWKHPIKYFEASVSEMPIGKSKATTHPVMQPAQPRTDAISLSVPTGPPSPEFFIFAAQMCEKQGDVPQAVRICSAHFRCGPATPTCFAPPPAWKIAKAICRWPKACISRP